MTMPHFFFLLFFALLTWPDVPALAANVREEEINECRPGELVTWKDGADRPAIGKTIHVAYRHGNAPNWFEAQEVELLIRRAAQAWSGCGILAETVASSAADLQAPETVLILWDEADSQGNFGLANVTRRRLYLGLKAFEQLRRVNPAYDARQTLQMVISHELGHFFGLMAHSRRCVDVLSYYHDNQGTQCLSRDPTGLRQVVEYRSILPTACDIERCRAINRLPPLKGGRLQ